MAAHGKQSEKCRREATWLDGKPYLNLIRWYPLQNLTQIPAKPKMGQIWVNSQKSKNHPRAARREGWFSAADFSEKQCYLYNRYC